jgi:signal transduction histidine kinase
MEETNRVNNLITELLDLAKPKESYFEFSDLNALIRKMVLLISPQSKAKNVAIDTHLDSSLEPVWLDAEKMKQVILNIISNAVDATESKGLITVSTGRSNSKNLGKAVRIEIADNGHGIPKSMINKVFDPYFTTKHKSNIHSGTGLGLFVSHQNMQDHGGTLEVQSKVGEGTTFILTLPSGPASQKAQPKLQETGIAD